MELTSLCHRLVARLQKVRANLPLTQPLNQRLTPGLRGLVLTALMSGGASTAFAAAPVELQQLDTDTSLRAVYLLNSEEVNRIKVAVLFAVGEVDLTGPEGMSHYLEHLMFWHADKVNDSPYHARGGNAWVNGVVTTYFNVGEPSELADMLTFATRLFTTPRLQLRFMREERDIVAREYDLRVSENPDARVFSRLRRSLYADNPLGRSTIGTPESIAALTVKDAIAVHKQFYHPANAIVLIAGNISADQARDSINGHFKSLAAGARHTQAWRDQPPRELLQQQVTFADDQVATERLAYLSLSGWQGSSTTGDGAHDSLQDDYTAGMLERILGSALPGSLAKPLRLDKFVLRRFEVSVLNLLAGQVEFALWAEPDDGVAVNTAASEMQQALSTLAEQGVNEKTLERVRKRWLQTESRLKSDLEHQEYRFFRGLSLGQAPNSVDDHLARIKAVSLDDVQSLLRAIAVPERKITGFITPAGG